MYYILKKDFIFKEEELKSDVLLDYFGSMTSNSLLCRIFKCYNFEFNYDLSNQQLIIKDLTNNETLEQQNHWWSYFGKDVTIEIDGVFCEDLIFHIKRKSGLDISASFYLKDSRKHIDCDQWTRLDFQDKKGFRPICDKLEERESSKYGICSIKDNTTGKSFYYDSNDLNRFKFKSGNFYDSYLGTSQCCMKIVENNSTINYKLRNGIISTMAYNDTINPKKESVNSLIPLEDQLNLFTDNIKPFIHIIKSDLEDLISLKSKSRLEYLTAMKNSLLKEQDNYLAQLNDIYLKLQDINQEITSIEQVPNEDEIENDNGNSYTKKTNN